MKRLPRYGQLPVTLLGRLAVARSVGGRGVGEVLLVDALRRSLEAAQQIAAMAVIVELRMNGLRASIGISASSRSRRLRCVCSCPWGKLRRCSRSLFDSIPLWIAWCTRMKSY